MPIGKPANRGAGLVLWVPACEYGYKRPGPGAGAVGPYGLIPVGRFYNELCPLRSEPHGPAGGRPRFPPPSSG